MNTRELLEKLFDYIENYYRYNPDTLMPMLMAALAAKGKLLSSQDSSSQPHQGLQTSSPSLICSLDVRI